MKLKKAIENLNKQLEHLKQANECGLATKGEFNEDIESIETVLQELEEVTEERNDYRTQLNGAFDNGFIPKKIIEDKIAEYKKMADDFYAKFIKSNRLDKDIRDKGFSCDRKIEVLQELINDK